MQLCYGMSVSDCDGIRAKLNHSATIKEDTDFTPLAKMAFNEIENKLDY